jgi:hypothetical protein
MFLILGLALAAVAALAAEISIDADRTLDYSAFKTYAWRGGDTAADPAVAAAIVAVVEEQLAAKGLHKVEMAPDLYVHYHVKQRDDVKITDWDEGKFKLENRKITEKWAKVGTLVIDLVDAKTGTVIWRAAASETLKTTVANQDFLDGLKRTVGIMLTQYPPKKG